MLTPSFRQRNVMAAREQTKHAGRRFDGPFPRAGIVQVPGLQAGGRLKWGEWCPVLLVSQQVDAVRGQASADE